MQFEGAKITEQGITFGLVVVTRQAFHSSHARREMQIFGVRAFGEIPIILMAQDHDGTALYYGREDIVDFLANIDPSRIPLRRFTI